MITARMHIGQVYTWQDIDGTVISWSIPQALEIIGDRPPLKAFAMPPEIQRQALESNAFAHEFDEAYARTTDLTKPIIAVVSPTETKEGQIVLLIIDGWHRIKHSVLINNPNSLPVHVLLPHEERACRIELINKPDWVTTEPTNHGKKETDQHKGNAGDVRDMPVPGGQ